MTTPPVPQLTEPTDVRTMAVVQTVYRREFRLAAGLVRGVPPGETARARVVADHLGWLGDHLHRHHTVEDLLLWPLLLDRVPDELAPVVHLMETQHRAVDDLQGQVGEVLPRWRATADTADRDRLAGLLDRLYVHLVEHLDAEEQRLLPIAARAVTQAEWDAMGEAAHREAARRDLLLALGMVAYEGDPVLVAGVLAGASAPVRTIAPPLARRAFRRHARRVHGTPTP